MKNIYLPIALIIFLSVALASVLASINDELKKPLDLNSTEYVKSDTCIRCHPTRYQSWQQTYHRTMTQTSSSKSVLGDFSDVTYNYNGINSRFYQKDGKYFIYTINDNGSYQSFEIVRTVGSRRIQQYVTKIGDRHIRLPLAWNIEEKRWFHLNGGFLDPDGTDFNKHLSLWDANCIFCHNVNPNPGYDLQQQTFNSKVAEQGIACESCHGPAKEHILRNSNPLRRYLLYYSSHSDQTIVSPIKLPKEAQLQVCGRCHGQRQPNPTERIKEFMTTGDPFIPSHNLNNFTKPLWIDSKLPSIDLSLRFWADGTPRLTAYEYQGILQSVDYQKGNLTCLSCHNMHGGDPKGMINPEMRTNKACLQCHEKFQSDISAHTKHLADSSGSNCYNCHMPKMAYGILQVHRSHRIQKPDPSRSWKYKMPEACTLCHNNQNVIWAAKEFNKKYSKSEISDLPTDTQYEIAENIRALFAGDVVQRTVALSALSRDDLYIKNPKAQLWTIPFFLLVMEKDRYPAIRHFAYRSLKTVVERLNPLMTDLIKPTSQIAVFDPQSNPESRQKIINQWGDWWNRLDKKFYPHPGPAVPLDENFQIISSKIDYLLANQPQGEISIGE